MEKTFNKKDSNTHPCPICGLDGDFIKREKVPGQKKLLVSYKCPNKHIFTIDVILK